MTDLYTTRRIGVVVPSVNTVVESWLPDVLPAGVRLHVGRMLIGQAVTAETLHEMDGHGVEAARTLATVRPDVILYGCTASSLVGGREYDLELMSMLSEATGITSLTTTECVLRALRSLGIGTVAAASPYTEEIGAAEVRFLEANGHPVRGESHLGIVGGFELAVPSAAEIAELGRTAWKRSGGDAEALFIGCMNLDSHLVLAELEEELGVPVVSATSASLWAALTEIGLPAEVPGHGQLLARP